MLFYKTDRVLVKEGQSTPNMWSIEMKVMITELYVAANNHSEMTEYHSA